MWCLGKSHFEIGDHRVSYDCLQEAYWLFNTLPLSEVESQRLGYQCGLDLMDSAWFVLSDYNKELSLAQDIETKCAALSDSVIHGCSLVLLGAMYQGHKLDEALRCLHQVQTMLKAVENTYNLANVYQIISWVHYFNHRLPAALDTSQEAWKLAQLTDNPLFQAEISVDLSRVLFNTNRDTEAWKYLEIALMKASHAGSRFTAAQALEYMGYGYLCRGDYQNAYGAYEAAAEKYVSTVDAHMSERCHDNMARIKQKEGNPNTVVGFHRLGIDIDKTLFYPPCSSFCK